MENRRQTIISPASTSRHRYRQLTRALHLGVHWHRPPPMRSPGQNASKFWQRVTRYSRFQSSFTCRGSNFRSQPPDGISSYELDWKPHLHWFDPYTSDHLQKNSCPLCTQFLRGLADSGQGRLQKLGPPHVIKADQGKSIRDFQTGPVSCESTTLSDGLTRSNN